MLVANFYHLKNTNGLFYYGVDYLLGCQKGIRRILVRPSLFAVTQQAFPDVPVVACNFWRFLFEVICATARSDFLYAPSSHPLPFLSKQMVVVHDVYPFLGRIGRLKRFLFYISITTSKCRIGYINKCEVKPFIANLGVSESRQIFAPNKFPIFSLRTRKNELIEHTRLSIGLMGTDSKKKNYHNLFAAILAENSSISIDFIFYGHPTLYYHEIIKDFPEIKARLVESDLCPMDSFFSQVDMVVSVADNEGFGRPIAAALSAGVPCLLLERPVFLEFFGSAAKFAPDVKSLVNTILNFQVADQPELIRFMPPASVSLAYQEAVAFLQENDS